MCWWSSTALRRPEFPPPKRFGRHRWRRCGRHVPTRAHRWLGPRLSTRGREPIPLTLCCSGVTMSFTLEVEFSGLCLFVLHPDEPRVAVLMPDARKSTANPVHVDGTRGIPHVGYTRFDLANT